MMVRKAQVLLLLAALSFTFIIGIACSGGDDEPSGDATNTATGTAAVATATSQAHATATSQARATATSVALGTLTPGATATSSTGPGTPTTPPNAIARAGDDIDTRRGNFIGLNGSGSSDPDGDDLRFTWTQVWGPDVTGGAGRFIGPTPSFAVPGQVGTLIFELTVNDGNGESAPDRVRVNIFEHVGNPGLFVNGNSGSDDTGNGTRENPFGSIGQAIRQINGPDQDIHVMSLGNGGAYEEPDTLSPPVTTSLYGGYGPNWIRDVEGNKTRVNGAALAVRFGVVDELAWISGFDITGADATSPGQNTFALMVAAGGATLFIEDNILRAGNAGNSVPGVDAGTSYGLWLGRIFHTEVRRNEIVAGNGGNGSGGPRGENGASATTSGGNGSGGTGGSAGRGGIASINGGGGGKGAGGIIPGDGSAGGNGGGANGGAGGIGDKVGAGAVGDGSGGGGGAGGNGGAGASARDRSDRAVS